jgi:ABC-type nitrate/sulfonate/bicarbonate transport system ATPase subunit/ABC-type nitrate/sulfonate/bicarbonate transport system permease component
VNRPGQAAPGAKPVRLRLLGAAGVVLLFLAWAVASLAAGSFFVPAPWTTAVDTAVLLARAGTWSQILTTFVRVCVGFLLGFAAGTAAGMAIGSRRETAALLKPLVMFFQGMPPLLWAIPLVALMGIGHVPAVIVITLITFPLVAVTIGEGMTTLPRELGEMLSVFAPGFRARTRELVLPHLAPFFGAAVNAGLVLAVKASVTAEYFGANDGIGFQIQAAYMSLRIRSLFSWAAVLILVILAFTSLLPRIRRWLSSLGKRLRERGTPAEEQASGKELMRLLAAPRSLSSRSSAREKPRVTLKGVSFSHRHQRPLLQDVSLAVLPGEIAVVTGESGIGKTTLLKLAASLLRPSRGTIGAPRCIGYVFQDDRLLPWRSVAENTALPLRYQGFPWKSARGFAFWLLAQAGLAGEEGKRPHELSGGMKKRAALARCFARLPDAILMDEPFSGLHAGARADLWEMFLRLHALHPVPAVIVTHYPEEIAARGRCRVYSLEGRPGRLVAAGRARRSRRGA